MEVSREGQEGVQAAKNKQTNKKPLNIVGKTHRCKLFRSIEGRKYIWVAHRGKKLRNMGEEGSCLYPKYCSMCGQFFCGKRAKIQEEPMWETFPRAFQISSQVFEEVTHPSGAL